MRLGVDGPKLGVNFIRRAVRDIPTCGTVQSLAREAGKLGTGAISTALTINHIAPDVSKNSLFAGVCLLGAGLSKMVLDKIEVGMQARRTLIKTVSEFNGEIPGGWQEKIKEILKQIAL